MGVFSVSQSPRTITSGHQRFFLLAEEEAIFTLREPRYSSIIAESASHRFTKSDTKTYYRKDPVKYALGEQEHAPRESLVRVSDDWQFFWVSREWMTTQFDRHRFKDGQLVCHFRNDYELTRKDCLIKNHKKAKKFAGANSPHMDYLPASYVLPMEYHLFVEEFRKYNSDTMWIMKPVSGAQGRGIFLFKKLKDIQEWKKKGRSTDSVTQPYVVQTYVCNPYLIGGKKFDMRLYVLVTSFRPLNAWIHREGFARFSHSRYSMDSCEDAFVHLTNVAIAKAATDYDPERGLKWSLDRLTRYIAARHGHATVRRMLDNIANIIIQSLRSVQNQIMQDNHCFELYGYDIMLDEHLKPWLLEVGYF
uniref:Tubulin--tyrosine ligase-like protein 9 n=1 Tax=Panagrellus redivivus TaxID=6233 RepID=A0A7E4VS38_PANRE